MGQRTKYLYAAVKDVQIKLVVKEVFASGMGQRMEQRSNNAAVKDAQKMLSKEECA